MLLTLTLYRLFFFSPEARRPLRVSFHSFIRYLLSLLAEARKSDIGLNAVCHLSRFSKPHKQIHYSFRLVFHHRLPLDISSRFCPCLIDVYFPPLRRCSDFHLALCKHADRTEFNHLNSQRSYSLAKKTKNLFIYIITAEDGSNLWAHPLPISSV